MKKSFAVICLSLCAHASFAQDYLWPTDASRFMTSSFGESRPRRFHMALDIKTWNRTGYKVFATRNGYIERLSVSPFGYGRALYLRLDTGETVVYAHLERFNASLQEIVEREQDRQGAYRLEKHFNVNEVPVTQGEVLGFTGQSGIGVPHLHFEIRDAHGRPINPLHKGFGLVDQVAPSTKEIAVSPLQTGAMIDGDFVVRTYSPVLVNGRLQIPQPIRVSGKIGFAVEAFDRTTGVNNRFAVYRYQLYIDGSLQFQSQFDRFSYDENRLIELVQDYPLQRRERGVFHKLYREAENTLGIYSALNSAHGAIAVARDSGRAQAGSVDAGRGLSWGLHEFTIVAEDFDGNRTTVEGRLLAGPPFELQVTRTERRADGLVLHLNFPAAHNVKQVAAETTAHRWHGTQRPAWRAARAEVLPLETAWLEAVALAAAATDSASHVQPQRPLLYRERAVVYGNGVKWLRLQAQDQYGIFSLPAFLYAEAAAAASQPFHLEVKKDFHTHFLRLEVAANVPLLEAPRATFKLDGREVAPKFIAQEPNRYLAAVPLAEIAADSVLLNVAATSFDGAQTQWEEKFCNLALTPERGGTLRAHDGRLRARFEAGALYWPLYGRVHVKREPANHPLVIGPVYSVEPQDVPLRTHAIIEMSYPDTSADPSKLGIGVRTAERAGGRWNFIASRRNSFAGTLSATVSSLNDYALMKDEEPPVLVIQLPASGTRVKTRRPLMSCRVVDHISGFDSERDIQLRLDGKLLIAEYDPEREIVQYQPKQDLSPGTHVLTARAVDQCGNVTEREVSFIVP